MLDDSSHAPINNVVAVCDRLVWHNDPEELVARIGHDPNLLIRICRSIAAMQRQESTTPSSEPTDL